MTMINPSPKPSFIPSIPLCTISNTTRYPPTSSLCNRQLRTSSFSQKTSFQISTPTNKQQSLTKWRMTTFEQFNTQAMLDRQLFTSLRNKSVVVTGGTGLIGVVLVRALREAGANVCIFARDPPKARSLFYEQTTKQSPNSITIVRYDSETSNIISQNAISALQNASVIINLAGESVADGRWTPSRKQAIYDSRVNGTAKLVETLQSINSTAVLISASAVGYYGASETEYFTEESPPGDDFLAQTAVAWEAAATKYQDQSRTVVFRMGVVLARQGGALEKMSAAFKAFLGGPPGGGYQWFSWVHIDDIIRILLHAAADDRWNGIYNATAPKPVRLKTFCNQLGRVLGRPSWLPVPKQAIQVLLGNEAAQLILAGQQVVPQRARKQGFVFKYRDVGVALDQLMVMDNTAEIARKI